VKALTEHDVRAMLRALVDRGVSRTGGRPMEQQVPFDLSRPGN
jgi:hypothetical protein